MTSAAPRTGRRIAITGGRKIAAGADGRASVEIDLGDRLELRVRPS